jgi:heme exporter protein A
LQCVRNNQLLFLSLNFTINDGEVLHLQGENGIGKTTLLRCLAGFSKPYAGEIRLLGRKITGIEDVKHYLLYLGHKLAIKDSLTAFENLHYLTLSDTKQQKKIAMALERVGLANKRDQLAGSLSAGQKQRLALARLLLSSARLWILDEPFTALDRFGLELVRELITEQTESGGMVILTSHHALSKQFNPQKSIELIPSLKIIDQGFF